MQAALANTIPSAVSAVGGWCNSGQESNAVTADTTLNRLVAAATGAVG